VLEKFTQQVDAGLIVEVARCALGRTRDDLPGETLVIDDRRSMGERIAATRRGDVNDLGPQVAQQRPRYRARRQPSQNDGPNTVERLRYRCCIC
jgi:hypothetical protein